jgi:hypothetical protein
VIVDRAGGIHSLARRIDGTKAAELRTFMADVKFNNLPDTERAIELALEMGEEARKAKKYARGADYVSQTQAAQKDFEKRHSELNARADAIRLFDYGEPQDGIYEEAGKDTGTSQAKPNAAKEPRSERRERLKRIEDELRGRESDDDPDRQREAPGGGRSRSR